MTQYGLIGKSLKHSFSKDYFTEKFIAQNIDAIYNNFEIEEAQQLLEFLQVTACNYFNITIPYKEKIIPLLASCDHLVKQIGATNCIKKINGLWHGTNTDCLGFENSFKQHLLPHHTKALILGNGGASKAVQFVLKKLNIPFVIISRAYTLGGLGYQDITEAIISNYPIIINTTPLGMHPHIQDAPPLPYHLLSEKNFLYDLIYNPTETLFLQKGKIQNAICVNGSEMLALQADAAWEYWTD